MAIEINEEEASISATLSFERMTKNTVLYKEEGTTLVNGRSYISKEMATKLMELGGYDSASPARIKITVTALE